jgi:uncharacterized protein (TIGR02001 family)
MSNPLTFVATLLVSAFICAPAFAQTGAPGDFELAGSAGLWSQYRFRGVSLSDEDPAAQASLTLSHKSGLYAGAWASTADGFGRSAGADMELDLYGGYGGDFALGSYDVGVLWYAFPGAENADRVELYGSLTGALGPARAKLGVNWAPSQDSLGNEDNLYLYTELSSGIPASPVTLRAHLGYTNGALSPARLLTGDSDYLDWSLGADYALGPVTLGLSYVDTDVAGAGAEVADLTDAAIVASISVGF